MTRPLRLLVPDGTYHAVARGINRAALFRDDADHAQFLRILARVVDRMGWALLAYCLMGNHYHLLLRTPEANVARGMQQLNSSYAQALNTRYKRSGPVFQGRFHGALIERDSHVLEVIRYIALNPVRAGLVRFPENWRWSSYAATIGAAPAPAFLAVNEVLRWFDGSAARYFGFVAAGDPETDPDFDGVVFGNERFVQGVLADTSRSPEIARRDWSAGRPLLRELFESDDRDAAVARAYREHGYPLSTIALWLGVHVSTVSRALRAFERRDDG
jgi:REP element-mobilizing transposase RayT